MCKHVVSFSGGKDSTAMLLMMLEKGIPVDDVVFFDTGWEFPEMYEHIKQVEEYTGIKITILKPKIPFTEMMLNNHRTRGKRVDVDYGYGFPNFKNRWCTRIKINTLRSYLKKYDEFIEYVGIAADEQKRMKDKCYPLVDWGMTEKDCLDYCYSKGFDWGGLYEHSTRVSCFCCPLQRINSLRNLRKYHPDLWNQMLEWDSQLQAYEDCPFKSFRVDYTLQELELKFRKENNGVRS